jgi:hypothetical protein
MGRLIVTEFITLVGVIRFVVTRNESPHLVGLNSPRPKKGSAPVNLPSSCR